MLIPEPTYQELSDYYDRLETHDIPVAVAMPNKSKRREYGKPTEETIAIMKYTRDLLHKISAG